MRDQSGIDALLNARSLAVVGASDRVGSWGWRVLQYLERYEYQGEIVPINPARKMLAGVQSLASVSEFDGTIDHALILVPASKVVEAVRECAGAGVRSVSVTAGGFAESGEDGARAQDEILSIAQKTGMRVLGPNCLGSINRHSGMVSSASSALLTAEMSVGPVSILTQSGAVGAYLLSMLGDRGLGLRYYVSTGNELDIQFGEMLSFVADDIGTSVVVLYVEGVRDPSMFVEGLTRAKESGKAVIVVKSGRTEAGAAAVRSHTAALAGDDEVYNEVFKRLGVIRAQSLAEVTDVVAAAVRPGRPLARTRRAVVVTTSGGLGVLSSESLADAGFATPTPSSEVRSAIGELFPLASPLNPVDLAGIGADNIGLLEDVLSIIATSGEFDAIGMIMSNAARSPHVEPAMTDILLRCATTFAGQIMAVGHLPESSRRRLEQVGVGVLEDPCDLGRQLALVWRLQSELSKVELRLRFGSENRRLLDPLEASSILSSGGVAFPPWRDVTSGVLSPFDLNFPVAVKLIEPDVVHKSELGFVRLDVSTPEEVARHVQDLNLRRSALGRIVIEEMISDPEYELIVGGHVDPTFGLVYTVGLGGYFAEVFRDIAVIVPPLTQEAVAHSLRGLSTWDTLLSGFRGGTPVNPDAVFGVLGSIESAFESRSDVVEIELNPVIVSRAGLIAVDAAVWASTDDWEELKEDSE